MEYRYGTDEWRQAQCPRFESGFAKCFNCGDIFLHQFAGSASAEGATLDFWCEGCPAVTRLTIEHSKGNTVVRWHKLGFKKNAYGPPTTKNGPTK